MESGRTQMEATKDQLNILMAMKRIGGPAGAARLGACMRGWGVELKERSLRFHLRRLDGAGLTELVGRRAGRALTARGQVALARGGGGQRPAFAAARIEAASCQMGFDLRSCSGGVACDAAFVPARLEAAALDVVRPVLAARLGMGSRILLLRKGERLDEDGGEKVQAGQIALATVGAATLQGIMLREGIPCALRCGGLLEYRNRLPTRFVELIGLGGVTQDPAELFIRAKMTSVLRCERTGNGLAVASFLDFPSAALAAVREIRERLGLLGLDGILSVGERGGALFGIAVGEGRTGMAVFGGLNPAAALAEAGMLDGCRCIAGLIEYRRFPEYRHLNMCVRRGRAE